MIELQIRYTRRGIDRGTQYYRIECPSWANQIVPVGAAEYLTPVRSPAQRSVTGSKFESAREQPEFVGDEVVIDVLSQSRRCDDL
jgi:hypothetical protein